VRELHYAAAADDGLVPAGTPHESIGAGSATAALPDLTITVWSCRGSVWLQA
jgi:hypothetical protein